MRKNYLLLIALIFSFSCFATIKRVCNVKYETADGWSKVYTMEVEFSTGYRT